MRKMKPILSWILAMSLLFANVEYVGAAQITDSGLVEEAENVFEEDEFGFVTGGDGFTEGTNSGEDVTSGEVTTGDATQGDVIQNHVTSGDVTGGDTEGKTQNSVVDGAVLYSGEKGGITWQLTKDGVLTIAGEDTSKYWSSDHMPWLEHASLIKKAVVKAKNVKDTYRWFFQCENLESVDFRNFDTSSVFSMGFMFCCCEKLTNLDLSGFDTSNVYEMDYMFYNCYKLKNLNLSSFDTSNVWFMNSMFENCYNLTTLDVSNFDTSNVLEMQYMFKCCSRVTALDVSGFNTSKVCNMNGLFDYCYSLSSLDVSGFDTSNVESMRYMFADCESLFHLDLSSFNTGKTTTMASMFKGCDNLVELDVSGFDMTNVTDVEAMFEGCSSIVSIKSFANLKTSIALPMQMCDTEGTAYSEFPLNVSEGIDLYVLRMVTFDQGVSGESDEVIAIKHGDTFVFPKEPVRKGYCFGGWYTEQDGKGKKITEKTVVKEDLTLYAFWYQNGFWVDGVKEQKYTGKAIKPVVCVYDGDKLLKEKVDYTVSYKNNIDVSVGKTENLPTVIVKGKGNYTGTESCTFRIYRATLNSSDVRCDEFIVRANGKVQKAVPTLTYNGIKLKNNKDFTVSYPDLDNPDIEDAYKAPGTYTVRLVGNGNFSGTRDYKLTITDGVLMSKTKIAPIPPQEYVKNGVKPDIKVTYQGKVLVNGTDYKVNYWDNYRAGKATVVVTGMGNYVGTKKATFTIKGISLKKATVTGIVNKEYTGKPHTQRFSVIANGSGLNLSFDYDVSYSNNINAGTASVIITGKGNYYGTIQKIFKITPYDIGKDAYNLVSGIEENLTVAYSKGGATPTLNLSFYGTELENKKDYTASYSNNKKVASITDKKAPTIKIKGKGNFKGTITVPFNIVAKDLADDENPVTLKVSDVAYSAKAGKYISKPVLVDSNGKKLVAGTDYEKNVVYTKADGTVLTKKDAPEAGTVIKVIVNGKGYYSGTLEANYQIAQASFKNAKVKIENQEYNSRAVTLSPEDITVKIGKTELKYGEDYVIVEGSYMNNTKKGTASVTLKGIGNYAGEKNVKFKIVSKKIIWL